MEQAFAVGGGDQSFGERLLGRVTQRPHRLQFGEQVTQHQRQLARQQLLPHDPVGVVHGLDADLLGIGRQRVERFGEAPPGAGRQVPREFRDA